MWPLAKRIYNLQLQLAETFLHLVIQCNVIKIYRDIFLWPELHYLHNIPKKWTTEVDKQRKLFILVELN